MADRPGFMLYFDDWQPIIDQGDADAGFMFFAAAFEYARTGNVPYEFEGTNKVVWAMLQGKIDRDKEKYRAHIINQRYKGYRSAESKKIRDRLTVSGELKGKSDNEVSALVETHLLDKEAWLKGHLDNIDEYGRPLYL